jgi:hypothetical protein
MPTTSNENLTLTRLPNNMVRITVQYQAHFTPRERCMTGCGVRYRELIAVMGVDDPPAGPAGDAVLNLGANGFAPLFLGVTQGNAPQTIARNRSVTVPRAALNEDPQLFNSDEIRVRIRIVPSGLPIAHTAFTDIETLVEGVILPADGQPVPA